jgi:GT2 family glycosyltransferase
MKPADKLVYILILNWNGYRDTIDCVESCFRLSYPNFKILVVDNGSTDGSETVLRDRFPQVEIMQTGRNLGFAGGNNVGIRHAVENGADYVWLLNNDTVVAADSLTELVDAAAGSRVGVVGSKIYYHDDPDTLWFAGGWINYKTSNCGHIGQLEKDNAEHDVAREVDYITGCSLMISDEAIKCVGVMDERFFLLFEEVDWNVRVREHGYKIVYVPTSIIWHKISRSLGEYSQMYYYYMFRNSLLFLFKHQKKYLPTALFTRFREIRRLYRIGQREKIRFALMGILDFLKGNFYELRDTPTHGK